MQLGIPVPGNASSPEFHNGRANTGVRLHSAAKADFGRQITVVPFGAGLGPPLGFRFACAERFAAYGWVWIWKLGGGYD